MSFSFRKILSNIAYFKKDSGSDLALEVPEEALEATPGKKRRHSAPGTPTSEKTDFKLGEYDTTTRKYTTVRRTMANTVLYFRAKSDDKTKDIERDQSPPPAQLPDIKKLRLDCYRSPSIQLENSDSEEFTFPSRESSPEFLCMARDEGLEKDILEAMRESPDAPPRRERPFAGGKFPKMSIMNLASKIKATSAHSDLRISDLCSTFEDAKIVAPTSSAAREDRIGDMQKCVEDIKTELATNPDLFPSGSSEDKSKGSRYSYKIRLLEVKSTIDRILTRHFLDVEVPKKKKRSHFSNRRKRHPPSKKKNKKKNNITHSTPIEESSQQTIFTSSLKKLTIPNESHEATALRDSALLMSSYSTVDSSAIFTQTPKQRFEFYSKIHKIQCRKDIGNDASLCLEKLWAAPAGKSDVSLLASDLNDKLRIDAANFVCTVCDFSTFANELQLLEHLYAAKHCEALHFVYKVKYIADCVAANAEILPSTVKRPMRFYRDANKIVCFGNKAFACSLCYRNAIDGEEALLKHCASDAHVFKMKQLLN